MRINPLGVTSLLNFYGLCTERLGSSSDGKDLDAPVANRLNMIQQGALAGMKAVSVVACINKMIVN